MMESKAYERKLHISGLSLKHEQFKFTTRKPTLNENLNAELCKRGLLVSLYEVRLITDRCVVSLQEMCFHKYSLKRLFSLKKSVAISKNYNIDMPSFDTLK